MSTKQKPIFHTMHYPISMIGIHIPIIGKPIFFGQCNWTGNYHEITADQFYGIATGTANEVDRLSFGENMGFIDPMTQSIAIRYDLMNTPASDQIRIDECIANLLVQRLTEMKVLPSRKAEHNDGDGSNDPFN